MRMKKSNASVLLLIIFNAFFINLFSQIKELDVPIIGQKASSWCWAASMEMIIDYHQVNAGISQCLIAEKYVKQLNKFRSSPITTTPSDSDCLEVCEKLKGWKAGLFNTNLSYNFIGMKTKHKPAFYDIILSDLNYNSIEDFNLLTWELYKEEINACRPIILMYSATETIDTKEESYAHAVVGKGYYSAGSVDYFLINDPLRICDGREFLLNRVTLNGQVNYTASDSNIGYVPIPSDLKIVRIKSMVHHISQKTSNCNDCNLVNEGLRKVKITSKMSLLKALEINKERFIGTNVKNLFSEKETKKFISDEHFSTPVYNFSYSFLKNAPRKFSFDESIVLENSREITFSGSEKPLKAKINCNNNGETCIVERIAFDENIQNQTIFLGERKFKLNNTVQQSENILNYEIVYYEPYSFEFYRVRKGESYYLIPKETASISLFHNIDHSESLYAIPENKVLEGLRLYTNQSLVVDGYSPQKQFDKASKRITKFQKKLQRKIY